MRCYDAVVRRARSLTAASVVITAAGLALLAWLIAGAGPQRIWQGLQQLGWGLAAIAAIAGLRFAVRAAAWMLCLEPPYQLRFTEAFTAVLCGDALGNATPLGPLVSEPAKVAFVRDRVPLAAAFTALAIENVFYTLSVAAMIAAGMAALLLRGGLDPQLRLAGAAGIVIVFGIYAAAAWMLVRRPAVLSRLTAAASRFVARDGVQHRLEKVRRLEQDIYTFASRRGASVGVVVATELLFHALGFLEVYLTLWLLPGPPPQVVTAFILETANRLLIVLFKFLPMQQLGVNVAGTVLVGRALGLSTETASTLAVVRGARMLLWQLVGTLLVVRHGMSARQILQDPDLQSRQGGAGAR